MREKKYDEKFGEGSGLLEKWMFLKTKLYGKHGQIKLNAVYNGTLLIQLVFSFLHRCSTKKRKEKTYFFVDRASGNTKCKGLSYYRIWGPPPFPPRQNLTKLPWARKGPQTRN